MAHDRYDRLVRMYGERHKQPDWAADKTGHTASNKPRLPVTSNKDLDKFFAACPDASDYDALAFMESQVGQPSVR